jgi:hypothetical protein
MNDLGLFFKVFTNAYSVKTTCQLYKLYILVNLIYRQKYAVIHIGRYTFDYFD